MEMAQFPWPIIASSFLTVLGPIPFKKGRGMRTGAPFRPLSIHIPPFQQTIINSSIHSGAITGRGGGWGAQPELAEVIKSMEEMKGGITGQRGMERLFVLELHFWDVLKCGARMGGMEVWKKCARLLPIHSAALIQPAIYQCLCRGAN
jgi:hypothetical protein